MVLRETAVEFLSTGTVADRPGRTLFDGGVRRPDGPLAVQMETARRLDIPLIMALGTGNKLDPSLLQVADISKTYGCPLARVMRKELRNRGILFQKVVFSPEEPVRPDQPETPPPGRRSVPASNPWLPAMAGLLLGSAVVRDILAKEALSC